MGILSLLDEECLFPEGTDMSFLQKMHKNFASNKVYVKVTGNTSNDKFALAHYAGDVRSFYLSSSNRVP
jgi:myosin heavy subunit